MTDEKPAKRDWSKETARRRVTLNMDLRQAERHIQEWCRRTYNSDHPITYIKQVRWVHVYHLIDPRDGSCFYIGKGGPWRLRQHEQEAERGWLSAKCRRIREIWMAGFKVEFRTIALFDDNSKACAYEAKLIRENDATITNNKPYGKWNDGNQAA